MTISLAYLTTTISLHPDLRWSDENNWFPVEQSVQRTVTGAMIVSSAARVAGRPITLEPESDTSAWMPASTIALLEGFAGVPGRVMQLTLRGTTRDVIFRHHDGTALESTPVVHYSDVESGDWYLATLRLMEI